MATSGLTAAPFTITRAGNRTDGRWFASNSVAGSAQANGLAGPGSDRKTGAGVLRVMSQCGVDCQRLTRVVL
jgi:hypothetical protein